MNIIQQYRVIRLLSEGTSRKTYEVAAFKIFEFNDKPHFAFKQLHGEYQSSKDLIDLFEKKVNTLALLGNKHDLIHSLDEYFKDEENFCIFKESIDGNTSTIDLGSDETSHHEKALTFLSIGIMIVTLLVDLQRSLTIWFVLDRLIAMAIHLLLEVLESFSKSSQLSPQYLNGKWGYKDEHEIFIIAPQFDWASSFSEGLAPVLVGNKYGYINISGKFLISSQFDYADKFSEGLAPVLVGDRYGYINVNGKFTITPQFDWGGNFTKGLAWVNMNHKYGYIDTSGEYVIPSQFDCSYNFVDGLARVKVLFWVS